MKNVCLHIAEVLCSEGIIEQKDIDVCIYGLEIFLMSMVEVLSILLVSLFVGNFIYTLLFFVMFIPLRIYAGGYHADGRIRCYIILVMTYIIFSLLMSNINSEHITFISVISSLVSLIIINLFAPIIHDKRTASEKERKCYRQISVSIAWCESVAILALLLMNLSGKFVLAMVLGQITVALSMVAALIKRKVRRCEV